jgi:hypothetical protein
LVISLVALFVALGGTSYAALSITGKNVKDSSLTGADIRDSSVTGSDVKDGSLLSKDFKPGQLVAGAPGPQGLKGDAGPKGDTGAKGAQGDKGDAGLPATKLFAAVDQSGNLSTTTKNGVVSASRTGTGLYQVTFDRDVSACVPLANVSFAGGLGGSYWNDAVIKANISNTPPVTTIDLAEYRASTNTAADGNFVIAVFC